VRAVGKGEEVLGGGKQARGGEREGKIGSLKGRLEGKRPEKKKRGMIPGLEVTN